MYLNCHSYHSLRYGTLPVEDLVALAKEKGVEALALTDVNTITGVYDFIKACREHNIKSCVGIEFREEGILRYIGIARNQQGFAALCQFRTDYNFEKKRAAATSPRARRCVYDLSRHRKNQKHHYWDIKETHTIQKGGTKGWESTK